MTGCLMVGAAVLALASPEFTLRWTHSVEKVEWVEQWRAEPDQLHLTQVAVKGSGAGMEPADDAQLIGGWWVWHADRRVPELYLAASGATGAGWTLCSGGQCHALGAAPGPALRVWPCGG